jgi:hypothetical protein
MIARLGDGRSLGFVSETVICSIRDKLYAQCFGEAKR